MMRSALASHVLRGIESIKAARVARCVTDATHSALCTSLKMKAIRYSESAFAQGILQIAVPRICGFGAHGHAE
jgi:hypothetical protein